MKPIADMTPHELNLAVAVEVMEWPHHALSDTVDSANATRDMPLPHIIEVPKSRLAVVRRHRDWSETWNPCADIAQAFEVLGKWKGEYYLSSFDGIYRCELSRLGIQTDLWDATLPLAICRAMLAARRTEKKI